MRINGNQATKMLHAVSGGSLPGGGGGDAPTRACASAACGSFGSSAAGGVAGWVPSILSKCHSLRGFQNLRKIAVTTSEKMPPPMSVMG